MGLFGKLFGGNDEVKKPAAPVPENKVSRDIAEEVKTIAAAVEQVQQNAVAAEPTTEAIKQKPETQALEIKELTIPSGQTTYRYINMVPEFLLELNFSARITISYIINDEPRFSFMNEKRPLETRFVEEMDMAFHSAELDQEKYSPEKLLDDSKLYEEILRERSVKACDHFGIELLTLSIDEIKVADEDLAKIEQLRAAKKKSAPEESVSEETAARTMPANPAADRWSCTSCGGANTGNFCVYCGTPKA